MMEDQRRKMTETENRVRVSFSCCPNLVVINLPPLNLPKECPFCGTSLWHYVLGGMAPEEYLADRVANPRHTETGTIPAGIRARMTQDPSQN